MGSIKRDSDLFQSVEYKSEIGYRPITIVAPDFQMQNLNMTKLLDENYFRGTSLKYASDNIYDTEKGTRSVVNQVDLPQKIQEMRGGSYVPIYLGLNEPVKSISEGATN